MALSTLAACHDLGLSVPRELAVIGYDATAASALFTPALTSVAVDGEAHGRLAACRALDLDTAGSPWSS